MFKKQSRIDHSGSWPLDLYMLCDRQLLGGPKLVCTHYGWEPVGSNLEVFMYTSWWWII